MIQLLIQLWLKRRHQLRCNALKLMDSQLSAPHVTPTEN